MLKLCVAKSWPLLGSARGPARVSNSPGAKAIIVDDMIIPPHWSVAVIPWKLAYIDGEVLMESVFSSTQANFRDKQTHKVNVPDTSVFTAELFF